MSLRRASVAGLLYALCMCAWIAIDRGYGLDRLMIRFAVYFSVFTLGFWFLYNLLSGIRRTGDRDR